MHSIISNVLYVLSIAFALCYGLFQKMICALLSTKCIECLLITLTMYFFLPRMSTKEKEKVLKLWQSRNEGNLIEDCPLLFC